MIASFLTHSQLFSVQHCKPVNRPRSAKNNYYNGDGVLPLLPRLVKCNIVCEWKVQRLDNNITGITEQLARYYYSKLAH
jgi:hypothetical protein